MRTPRRASTFASMAFALALASPAAWAAPVGATAGGNVSGSFTVGCTTCPVGTITLSGQPNQVDGGAGAQQAAVQYAGVGESHSLLPDVPDGVWGGGSYEVYAGFSALGATPLLRAYASADNEQVLRSTPTGVQFIGIDSYSVFAHASAMQLYTYLGTTPGAYVFNFVVDGLLEGSLASISAGAAFYDPNDPVQEVALVADTAYAQGVAGTSSFDDEVSVAITLDPGQSVLLSAFLSAGVMSSYTSEDSTANAWNTFKIASIQGDLSVLRAQLVPTTPGGGTVPLPASAALVLLGLALAGATRRRGPR